MAHKKNQAATTVKNLTTTHTPGPWHFGQLSLTVITTRGNLIADFGNREDTEQAAADARLIAKVPEMYAALVDLSYCAAAGEPFDFDNLRALLDAIDGAR